MANYLYFTGIAEWAQVKRPNKFGNWSLNLYVDKPTRKMYKDAGLRGTPKEGNEDYGDGMYLTFRRPVQRRWKNEVVDLTPPKVLMADGTEFDGLIGNGSKVTVKVEVYEFGAGVGEDGKPYGAGKGSRLDTIRIDELVEYVRPENNDNAEAGQQVAGLPF
jgi:hypothetical protein